MPAQELKHEFITTDAGKPAGGRTRGVGLAIDWQNGPIVIDGRRVEPNGCFVETVIDAARERIAYYERETPFACDENKLMLWHLEQALAVAANRTQRRAAAGVEGTHAPDSPGVERREGSLDLPTFQTDDGVAITSSIDYATDDNGRRYLKYDSIRSAMTAEDVLRAAIACEAFVLEGDVRKITIEVDGRVVCTGDAEAIRSTVNRFVRRRLYAERVRANEEPKLEASDDNVDKLIVKLPIPRDVVLEPSGATLAKYLRLVAPVLQPFPANHDATRTSTATIYIKSDVDGVLSESNGDRAAAIEQMLLDGVNDVRKSNGLPEAAPYKDERQVEGPMLSSETWDTFRDVGLLQWVNAQLHLFGWAIVTHHGADGKVVVATVARTRFRGFAEKQTDEMYRRLTHHLAGNMMRLVEDVTDDAAEARQTTGLHAPNPAPGVRSYTLARDTVGVVVILGLADHTAAYAEDVIDACRRHGATITEHVGEPPAAVEKFRFRFDSDGATYAESEQRMRSRFARRPVAGLSIEVDGLGGYVAIGGEFKGTATDVAWACRSATGASFHEGDTEWFRVKMPNWSDARAVGDAGLQEALTLEANGIVGLVIRNDAAGPYVTLSLEADATVDDVIAAAERCGAAHGVGDDRAYRVFVPGDRTPTNYTRAGLEAARNRSPSQAE